MYGRGRIDRRSSSRARRGAKGIKRAKRQASNAKTSSWRTTRATAPRCRQPSARAAPAGAPSTPQPLAAPSQRCDADGCLPDAILGTQKAATAGAFKLFRARSSCPTARKEEHHRRGTSAPTTSPPRRPLAATAASSTRRSARSAGVHFVDATPNYLSCLFVALRIAAAYPPSLRPQLRLIVAREFARALVAQPQAPRVDRARHGHHLRGHQPDLLPAAAPRRPRRCSRPRPQPRPWSATPTWPAPSTRSSRSASTPSTALVCARRRPPPAPRRQHAPHRRQAARLVVDFVGGAARGRTPRRRRRTRRTWREGARDRLRTRAARGALRAVERHAVLRPAGGARRARRRRSPISASLTPTASTAPTLCARRPARYGCSRLEYKR